MSTTQKATGVRKGARSGARWVVQCYDYTTGSMPSRASAERLLAQIEAEGKCSGTHRVIEVSK